MVVEDAHPVLAVEVHPLLTHEELGSVDVLEGDRTHQVVPDIGLETDEHRHRELATARLDVGRDVLGARRVERVVTVLVAVSVDQDVVELVAQGHRCCSFIVGPPSDIQSGVGLVSVLDR